MANAITSLRLLLVFIIIVVMFWAPPVVQLINPPLLIFTILLDGLDGFVARKQKTEGRFGSIFDIAADRVTEMVLWISFAYIRLVPLWVPLIIVTRGVFVDGFRCSDGGKTPFGMMQTPLGKFLVGGRLMRFVSGLLKILTFSWLLFVLPLSALWVDVWIANGVVFDLLTTLLVYATVAVNLLRGIPVLVEVYGTHARGSRAQS